MEVVQLHSKTNQGWRNTKPSDSIRHSLARKGISTTGKGNWKLEKLQELSESGDLNWETFRELFPEDPAAVLQKYVDEGKAEIVDAETVQDPAARQRFGEIRINVEDGDETQQLSVTKDTAIRFVSEEN